MTTPTSATLLSLADRVEAGSGVDRALDAEIACAVVHRNLRPAAPDDFDGKFGYSPGNMKVDTGFLMSRPYTGSLDAAMTLVPAGWRWMAGHREYPHARAYVENGQPAFSGMHLSPEPKRNPKRLWFEVTAATPARALVAACLRAGAMEADNA